MNAKQNKEEIIELLDERSAKLPRDQYRELIEELHTSMEFRLNALEDEDEE